MDIIIPFITFVLGVFLSEHIKNIFQNKYDLSKAEREFYNEMIENIYKFIAIIKKYEFKNNTQLTNKTILDSEELKTEWFRFKDLASEFIGKSYVFFKEESYLNLKNALDTSKGSFADLSNNLLDAMRKSLYSDTKLNTKNDLKEFKYK